MISHQTLFLESSPSRNLPFVLLPWSMSLFKCDALNWTHAPEKSRSTHRTWRWDSCPLAKVCYSKMLHPECTHNYNLWTLPQSKHYDVLVTMIWNNYRIFIMSCFSYLSILSLVHLILLVPVPSYWHHLLIDSVSQYTTALSMPHALGHFDLLACWTVINLEIINKIYIWTRLGGGEKVRQFREQGGPWIGLENHW